MVGTLYHRNKTICSSPNQLQKEEHLFKILRRCKYPTWALNRVKLKSQTPALKKNTGNNNNSDPNNSRSPKPCIVIPYHQGLSESFKRTCKKYGIKVHLKGGPTIKNSSWLQRTKIQSLIKVESYIDINVIGRSVMKNIFESQQEHLQRGLRNIWRPLPLHMTVPTSLVIMYPLIISPYWEERTKTSWGPSRRLYT